MISLKKSGIFLVEDNGNKKKLKKVFRDSFYRKGKYYYIKGTDTNYEKLLEYFEDLLTLSCYLYPLIKEFKRKKLKPKTCSLYFYINKKFLEFSQKIPDEIDLEDIRAYINHLRKEGKQDTTLTTTLNALRFFYDDILGKEALKNMLSRKKKHIPKVFSREEIYRLLNSVKNQKHKLLLEMAYSCGLKLNEIRKIKVSDIDLGRKRLYVRDKDSKIVRIIPISDTLIEDIKSYITGYYRDKDGYSDYLFFSEAKRNRIGKITERTIEEVFQKAVSNSGIKGHFTFSALRDSFVVHLLEKKFPISEIIRILGISKAQFYNRYAFYIRATQFFEIPDLLNFEDIKNKENFHLF